VRGPPHDRSQRPAITRHAITLSEDGIIVEAELVAAKLGLSREVFWQEMERGIVYGVVERGEGDDAGRARLTFRYRARSWSMTLEDMPP
jgi:hypothetical protein